MLAGVTPQFSQCSSDSMSDSDSPNRRVKNITQGISHSSKHLMFDINQYFYEKI